jgi:hypothetical protein
LLPVVAKVYEKLLLQWYQLRCGPKINPLQGACLDKCSSFNSALILQEGIAGLRGGGNTAYVCLLDTRKAFDTVWHAGLFYKLAKSGCNIHIWRILWNFYEGFKCSVQIAGGRSEWFVARQGVHQGGPFSMKLYTVFNGDILDQLLLSGNGAKLAGIDIACPAYADDIALVAVHKPHLQALLDIAVEHSRCWRYNFNPSKSFALVFGKDHCPQRNLCLSGTALNITRSSKHLGVPLAVDTGSLDAIIEEGISKGRRSFYASLALGNRYNPVPPLTLSNLYWSVSVPQMTYGLELVNLSVNARHALNSVHLTAAKIIQGLPVQTSTPAVLAPLQWWSMDGYLAYKRLLLLWRILLLPVSLIAKQVAVARIHDYLNGRMSDSFVGPIKLCVQSLVKYGLLNEVVGCVTSGIYLPLHVFKRTVKIIYLTLSETFICVTV